MSVAGTVPMSPPGPVLLSLARVFSPAHCMSIVLSGFLLELHVLTFALV